MGTVSHLPQQPPTWSTGPTAPGPATGLPAPADGGGAGGGGAGGGGAGAGRGRIPAWLLIALVLLVIALAAAATVAVVQTDRLGDQRTLSADLSAQVADQQDTIDQLESDLAQAGSAGPAPADTPGGDLDSMLEDLGSILEGDLDGLDELLGPDGPLGDLEDLLGPDGPFGDLEGVLGADGGIGQADTADCLVGLQDVPDLAGDDLDAQVTSATEIVQALRGLSFPEPVDVAVLTSEEIRDRIDDEVAGEYSAEAAEVDRVLLAALGAIPASTDLLETQSALLGDQVAGFYDPDTGELVVRSDDPDEPLDVLGQITLLHELEHALADAAVGLPALDDAPGDEDAALAEIAVVEGDAVALQTMATAVALAPDAFLGLLSDPDALAQASAGLGDVPHYLAQSLTFPYTAGPTWVCDRFAEGGWDAVDAALQAPPDTTWEILFGEDLDVTAPVAAPGPDGFEVRTERTFGAAQLSWLFAAPGGDPAQALDDPLVAARGWRGGTATVWGDGADDVVVLAFVDGGGLCEAVTDWWARAEPRVEVGEGTVVCEGEQVRLAVAPDEALALQALGR